MECVAGPGVGGCVSLVTCCLVCCVTGTVCGVCCWAWCRRECQSCDVLSCVLCYRNSVWSVLLGLVSEGVSVL